MTEQRKIKYYTAVTALFTVTAVIWTAAAVTDPNGLWITASVLAWFTAVLFGSELARLRGWFGRR